MNSIDTKDTAVVALTGLLEYAKYLEDNGQLSYDLLKQRVETYKSEKDEQDMKKVLVNHIVATYPLGTTDGQTYTIVPRP